MRVSNRLISLIVAFVLACLLCGCDAAAPESYPTLPDGCQKGEDHCGGVDPYKEPEPEMYPA